MRNQSKIRFLKWLFKLNVFTFSYSYSEGKIRVTPSKRCAFSMLLGLYLNKFAAEKFEIACSPDDTNTNLDGKLGATQIRLFLGADCQRSMVASTSSLVLSLMFALSIRETHQTVEQHRLEGETPSSSASARTYIRTTSSTLREGRARALEAPALEARALEARSLEARALEDGPLDAALAHDPTPRMCCMAYSIQCLAACAGMTEDKFCQVMFSHPLCATRLFAGRGWPNTRTKRPLALSSSRAPIRPRQ